MNGQKLCISKALRTVRQAVHRENYHMHVQAFITQICCNCLTLSQPQQCFLTGCCQPSRWDLLQCTGIAEP